jgi:hypothetical protein
VGEAARRAAAKHEGDQRPARGAKAYHARWLARVVAAVDDRQGPALQKLAVTAESADFTAETAPPH